MGKTCPVKSRGAANDAGNTSVETRDAARAGEDLDPRKARYARVVEYEVPDRAGDGKDELIALVTTITDLR